MKRCPKCKGTKFSVSIKGFQTYYSDIDSWEDVHVDEEIGEKPFFCVECQGEFKENELEEYKDE